MSNSLPIFQESEDSDPSSPDSKKWYKKGLNFSCTECGACCTGGPGHVWIQEKDIQNIAAFLKITPAEFIAKHTRHIGERFSLKEKTTFPHDCLFLKDKKCTIYPVRPTQCRTYPWWKENIESPKSWEEEKTYCEGIKDNAPLVSFEEIQKNLNKKHYSED